MSNAWSFDFGWWISVVELPVISGLFWLTQRQRAETAQRSDKIEAEARATAADILRALSDFKLDVARNYASIATLKDVELRLTEHLIRIETKLDQARREVV